MTYEAIMAMSHKRYAWAHECIKSARNALVAAATTDDDEKRIARMGWVVSDLTMADFWRANGRELRQTARERFPKHRRAA